MWPQLLCSETQDPPVFLRSRMFTSLDSAVAKWCLLRTLEVVGIRLHDEAAQRGRLLQLHLSSYASRLRKYTRIL